MPPRTRPEIPSNVAAHLVAGVVRANATGVKPMGPDGKPLVPGPMVKVKVNGEEVEYRAYHDFVASTSGPNRNKFWADQNSWKLTEYGQNPLVLYMHKAYEYPKGRGEVWVDREGTPDARLMVRIHWDLEDEDGRRCCGKVERGILSAVSIYASPGVAVWSDRLPEDHVAYDRRGRWIYYADLSLREVSIVTLAGDANALKVAARLGLEVLDLSDVQAGAGELEDDEEAVAASAPKPPDGFVAELKRGLAWVAAGKGGDGLEDATVRAARAMAGGTPMTLAKAGQTIRFYGRNKRFRKMPGFKPGSKGYPSAARVSWAVWGGDGMQAYARRVVAYHAKQKESSASAGNTGGSMDWRVLLLASLGLDEATDEQLTEAFTSAVAELEGLREAVRATLSLEDGDDLPEDIGAALAAATTSAEPGPGYMSLDEVNRLLAEAKAEALESPTAKAKELLRAKLAAGAVAPALKAMYTQLAEQNPALCTEMLEKAADGSVFSPNSQLDEVDSPESGGPGLSEAEKKSAARAGLTEQQYADAKAKRLAQRRGSNIEED